MSRIFFKTASPLLVILAVLAAFIFAIPGSLFAFSVDVRNLHYSDDSGRFINYDFTSGTVANNAIQLPDTAVTRGTDETGTTYFWGQAPSLPAVNVTRATDKATVSPVNAAQGGVAVLYAGPTLPPATGTTSWFFALAQSNFNVDLTAQKAYQFDIGLGRDESAGPYNNAFLNIVWVKGFYGGTLYPSNTLIVQAMIKNGDNQIWSSVPVIRTGLDPAATSLTFDLSVMNGNNFFAAVDINNEGMTNLGSYTLTTG